MKKILMIALVSLIMALTGCGGGGGGGGGPVTKAAAKVYLFGSMTSAANLVNQRFATVNATLQLPSAVMVNYSAAPNALSGLCVLKATNPPAGTCILRDTVVVGSGPVAVVKDDLQGSTYDIASRILTLSLVNSGSALKSNKTSNAGKGIEFATVNFNLATAGVLPAPLSLPLVPLTEQVGIETLAPYSLSYSSGDTLKIDWSYY